MELPQHRRKNENYIYFKNLVLEKYSDVRARTQIDL